MRTPVSRSMRRIATVVATAAFALAVMALPAGAAATVDEWDGTCSTFAASGTTTAPYYVIWVQYFDEDTEDQVIVYADAVEAGDGTFDFEVSFDAEPEGTELNYFVWGSPTDDPNDWDDEDYFDETIACVLAPEPPAPPAPPVVPEADAAPAELVPAAPRFTG